MIEDSIGAPSCTEELLGDSPGWSISKIGVTYSYFRVTMAILNRYKIEEAFSRRTFVLLCVVRWTRCCKLNQLGYPNDSFHLLGKKLVNTYRDFYLLYLINDMYLGLNLEQSL